MSWQKQTDNAGENLPRWDWENLPPLDCVLMRTRLGTGKADGLIFHEVEETTTKEKYSLLGNTVLDGIFRKAGVGKRILIEFKGKVKGKGGRTYKSFDWSVWQD